MIVDWQLRVWDEASRQPCGCWVALRISTVKRLLIGNERPEFEITQKLLLIFDVAACIGLFIALWCVAHGCDVSATKHLERVNF